MRGLTGSVLAGKVAPVGNFFRLRQAEALGHRPEHVVDAVLETKHLGTEAQEIALRPEMVPGKARRPARQPQHEPGPDAEGQPGIDAKGQGADMAVFRLQPIQRIAHHHEDIIEEIGGEHALEHFGVKMLHRQLPVEAEAVMHAEQPPKAVVQVGVARADRKASTDVPPVFGTWMNRTFLSLMR